MAFSQISGSILALSLASLLPPAPASARGGDAIVGGIIGGIIGGAIVNEAHKSKRAAPVAKSGQRKAAPDPGREKRREVQASLNYFGFNAGTPDGVFGRNTKLAIGEYQARLGYPATGELTAFQEKFLTESHFRAEAGGANTLAEMSRTPGGASGLLAAWHADLTGARPAPPVVVADTGTRAIGSTGGAPFLPAPSAPSAGGTGDTSRSSAPLPASPSKQAAAEPAPQAKPEPAPIGLPVFLPAPPAPASLTSHCNQVSMVTGTNGGFATLVSMTDPAQALDEQFCLARTYAISDGEELTAALKGFTSAQLTERCAPFGPVMADPVALLAKHGPLEAIPAAEQVAAGTGIPSSELASSAKICLSIGYRTDDMPVALGSALLLTALGELPYAELVGHHLMNGFGTSINHPLARDWFRIGIDAVANGQPAVFNPGQPERVQLIRALVFGEKSTPVPAPASTDKPAPMRLLGFGSNN